MQGKISHKNLLEIISLALISFIGILMTTATNVNFPEFVKYFHTPLSNVQWISTGAMIISAVTMICSTYLDKHFKDRTVYLFSTTALLCSLLICALTSNFDVFSFGRLLGGFSIGACTPLMFNVIPCLVPLNKIGFYMAVGATVLVVGPALGPTYGGFVNYYWSWRMIFLLMIPIVVIFMTLGLLSITNHLKTNKKFKFDGYGFAMILISFATLAIGFTFLTRTSLITLISFVIGILTMYLFLKHGSKDSGIVIINTKVLRHKKFACDALAYFIIQLTNIGLSSVLIPNFTQVALGISSLIAGLTLLPGNVFRMLGTPIGVHVLDKYGAKLPIYGGIILMMTYFVIMMIFNQHLSEMTILLLYILYNCGFALSFSDVLTDGLASLPKSLKSDGNAVMNAIEVYGGAIGVCLLSLIISLVDNYSPNFQSALRMKIGEFYCSAFLLLMIIIAFVSIYKGLNSKPSKMSN